eukprot:10210750-Karenia_brevis.AAC.1
MKLRYRKNAGDVWQRGKGPQCIEGPSAQRPTQPMPMPLSESELVRQVGVGKDPPTPRHWPS